MFDIHIRNNMQNLRWKISLAIYKNSSLFIGLFPLMTVSFYMFSVSMPDIKWNYYQLYLHDVYQLNHTYASHKVITECRILKSDSPGLKILALLSM